MIHFFLISISFGQNSDKLSGIVLEKNEKGELIPIYGANVYWSGTSVGTITDSDGKFEIKLSNLSNHLIVSLVGYVTDTIVVTGEKYKQIILQSEPKQVGEMEVVTQQASSIFSYESAPMIQIMTERELFKAACCNLSESFETNPSIDVSFTDAVTGLKQIEMLGLSGTYSQITVENMPVIRGLASVLGLTFFPGIWMESIQVSKGVGSVANGYESITGQINVELRKPEHQEKQSLFINLFGNQDRRFEGNLNYRKILTKYLSSMSLLHASTQRYPFDQNKDRFLDMPLSRTFNVMQRFHISYPYGFENQIGIQFVSDEKEGGTWEGYGIDNLTLTQRPKEYGFEMKTRQLRIFGKTGYVLPDKNYKSVAIQWSVNRYSQNAFFNLRGYNSNETMTYLNLIYQRSIDSIIHKFRTGISFLFDQYDETFTDLRLRRIERVPGVFFEYTFTPSEEFTVIGGIRADKNNIFGTFLTPRLHLRYAPHQDWVFRLIGGRGVRTANIFSENVAYFTSARILNLQSSNNKYPFNQESAWNAGLNITHYFLYGYRDVTITVDFYRTQFDNQVVVDLDSNPGKIEMYNLGGKSYSNSIQVELNFQPIKRLDTRIAYRFLDVMQTINDRLRERPFISRHRAFINLGYSTFHNDEDEPQMMYDLTVQWFGRKRMPDTESNPDNFKVRKYSPAFVITNAQVTRSFYKGLEIYLGVENLFDMKQNQPILDSANPDSQYFDGSFIWGPVVGRVIYGGVRWRM